MYVFSPMTAAVADTIDGWSYPPPYDFYDLAADPADREAFLDPDSWPDRTYAVREAGGDRTLVGFVSFTPGAETTDGDAGTESVEIGLGMAPDRTGAGEGAQFVTAGVAFAQGKFDPAELTLGVAAFNERAIRVYEAVGFEECGRFDQETNGDVYEFVGMRLVLR
jgi:ribosomal-protein-alanine N-acetyltransferase